ncbi:Lipid II:glycine glycyltransferase (Peptidoglycan interpeptide bridge formation enzyme) [Lachnospiraceae bacterium XBD2001]|nr:Lipid II:glycine glycyltransferase (Peptidoglycan interpeptide bridge formation enzyme) [Lachnospiraceae bacterium XBD2001]
MKITISPQKKWNNKLARKDNKNAYWDNVTWTKRRGTSLRLIVDEVMKQSDKKRVSVLMPELFDPEVEKDIYGENVEVLRYPLTDKLDPDWNAIKEQYKDREVDVFIFVHYFGMYHDANRAKTFCKQHDARLIEDASHCLYQYQKIGQAGDYVVFSSKYLLPTKECSWIINQCKESEQIALEVPTAYACEEAVRQAVEAYDYETLKRIAYLRRENCGLLNYFIQSLNGTVQSLIGEECESPFFAVYSSENAVGRTHLIQELDKIGFPVISVNDNLFALPVHQGIRPGRLARRLSSCIQTSAPKVQLVKLGKDDKARWEHLYNQIQISNITQHWAYGDMKQISEGWQVERFVIQQDGEDIGILQLLSKKKLGRKIVYRVNRGPIFILPENNIDLELATMRELKRYLNRPCLFFYVPYSVMTEENYIKTNADKWNNWDVYGYPSGVIDLTQSEEDLRKSLNSKWRNQLKTAEKYEHIVQTDKDRFDEMMELYVEEQEEKNFKGENPLLLRAMYNHVDQPLRFFYVENEEGNLIAYDIFYRHGQVATYFIGWNSEEGRKQCLNNLLLYQAAVHMKKEGAKTLDLGGIEYIQTEAVAKFKDGMMPKHYRQMGDFYKIF